MNNFRLVRNETADCREGYTYYLRHARRFSNRRDRLVNVRQMTTPRYPSGDDIQNTTDIIERVIGAGANKISPGAPA